MFGPILIGPMLIGVQLALPAVSKGVADGAMVLAQSGPRAPDCDLTELADIGGIYVVRAEGRGGADLWL